MEVSRSGFYDYMRAWHHPDPDSDQAALEFRIREIFTASGKTCGFRMILRQLKSEGHTIGRYLVRSVMRKLGLEARTPKRYKATTNSNHKYPIAPNLLNRQFDVDIPDRVWTTDITVGKATAGIMRQPNDFSEV